MSITLPRLVDPHEEEQEDVPKGEIFPSWLVQRQDFQELVQRLKRPLNPTAVRKQAGKRTEKEWKQILTWMEPSKLFQNPPGWLKEELAKRVQHREFEEPETICREGDFCDKAYWIYTGEIRVVFANSERAPLLLTDGDSFGEEFLEAPQHSNLIISAAKGTECLMLSSAEYHALMQEHDKADQMERARFLKTLGLFSHWSIPKLARLSGFFTSKRYRKGQVVLRKSDPPDAFYIVREGEFAVSAELETLKENKWPLEKHKWEISKTAAALSVTLKVLRAGEFFGEMGLLTQAIRSAKVTAVSDGEVLCLTKYHFNKWLSETEKTYLREYISNFPSSEELDRRERTRVELEKVKKEAILAAAVSSSRKIDLRANFSSDSPSMRLRQWANSLQQRKSISAGEPGATRLLQSSNERFHATDPPYPELKELHDRLTSIPTIPTNPISLSLAIPLPSNHPGSFRNKSPPRFAATAPGPAAIQSTAPVEMTFRKNKKSSSMRSLGSSGSGSGSGGSRRDDTSPLPAADSSPVSTSSAFVTQRSVG